MYFLQVATITLDVVSAFCALLVIAIFFIIKHYDYNAVDRVSIRLQLGIAFLDFFKHFINCFKIDWAKDICSAVGFLQMLLYHIYMCLNICIALNLNLIVLFSRRPSKRWEIVYWIASIALPLAINIPVLVAGIFGRNPYGNCTLIRGSKVNDNIGFIYNVGLSSITITYCLTIALLVIYKVKKENYDQNIERLANSKDSSAQKPLLSLKSLICRTCMYPSSFFLASVGSNVALTYEYIFKTIPDSLIYWARFGYCSRGILHLISFLSDPIVGKTILNLVSSHPEREYNQSKTVQENEDFFECDFSYESLVGPSPQPILPCLKNMVAELQRYI